MSFIAYYRTLRSQNVHIIHIDRHRCNLYHLCQKTSSIRLAVSITCDRRTQTQGNGIYSASVASRGNNPLAYTAFCGALKKDGTTYLEYLQGCECVNGGDVDVQSVLPSGDCTTTDRAPVPLAATAGCSSMNDVTRWDSPVTSS